MSFTIDLTEKTAVMTGSRKGIGGAIATAFAQAGANIIITGRKLEQLSQKKQELEALGIKASAYELDVKNKQAIDQFFEEIHQKFGAIDILVNNAGIEQVQASQDVDESLWDMILDTNLKGAFFCSRAFANLPCQHNKRSILNVCSLTSAVGIPTAVPYTSSKSGLAGMTKALSSEWASVGIRVNGIAPGYFYTDMTAGFYENQAWQDQMLSKIPMQRFGNLEDLMGASVFLCSDSASYITGQILYIDGGFVNSI